MEGTRYYKNMDFSKPVATHRYVGNIQNRRALAEVCLKAMEEGLFKALEILKTIQEK